MLQMETSAVSSKLKRSVAKLAKRSKDKSLRMRSLGLLALYEAELSEDYHTGLAQLATFILPENLAKSYCNAVKKHKKNKPLPIFPSPSKWNLAFPELCVVAAKLLALDKKHTDALPYRLKTLQLHRKKQRLKP